MAEEEPTQVVETPEELEDAIEGISHEDALKLIGKLRKEAASRRVKGKEAEEKAQKWEEHLNSQRTELEKVQAENAALKQTLEVAEVEKLRAKIAAELGLDPELSEFLVGSEKEMRAQAAKLAAKAGTKPAGAPDFYAGQRGTSVKPPADKPTFASVLTEAWNELDQKGSRRKFG